MGSTLDLIEAAEMPVPPQWRSWPAVDLDETAAAAALLRAAGALRDMFTVTVAPSVAAAAAASGTLVLRDAQTVPVGYLTVTGIRAAVEGAPEPILVSGAVRPLEGGAGLRALPRGAVALVTDRPLTRAELFAARSVASDLSAPLVVLARTSPGGGGTDPVLPGAVLRRVLEASVGRDVPVAELPLGRAESAAADAALVARVAANLGCAEVLAPGIPLSPPTPTAAPVVWAGLTAAGVVAALDSPGSGRGPDDGRDDGAGASGAGLDDLPDGALAELRRWRPERRRRGLVVMLTGLSGSGKSTIAAELARRVERAGRTVSLLDGDEVRRNLSEGLGFSPEDRDRNIRRIGWVAAEVARHGGVAVCCPIAPYAATRAEVRAMAAAHGDFVLVHVATPLEVCEARDRKGLYAKARAGELADFTGVSAPYERPVDAEVVVDTTDLGVDDAVEVVLAHLRGGGWLGDAP